eukprot:Sdes_comp15219_c0_seq1m4048
MLVWYSCSEPVTRKAQLEMWRAARKKKLEEESKTKKKPFVVSVGKEALPKNSNPANSAKNCLKTQAKPQDQPFSLSLQEDPQTMDESQVVPLKPIAPEQHSNVEEAGNPIDMEPNSSCGINEEKKQATMDIVSTEPANTDASLTDCEAPSDSVEPDQPPKDSDQENPDAKEDSSNETETKTENDETATQENHQSGNKPASKSTPG